jgi:hypothetical protein
MEVSSSTQMLIQKLLDRQDEALNAYLSYADQLEKKYKKYKRFPLPSEERQLQRLQTEYDELVNETTAIVTELDRRRLYAGSKTSKQQIDKLLRQYDIYMILVVEMKKSS